MGNLRKQKSACFVLFCSGLTTKLKAISVKILGKHSQSRELYHFEKKNDFIVTDINVKMMKQD